MMKPGLSPQAQAQALSQEFGSLFDLLRGVHRKVDDAIARLESNQRELDRLRVQIEDIREGLKRAD